MTTILKPSSTFAPLFRSWFGLEDHRIAWRRSDDSPLLSPGRFSVWFGRSSRRCHLCHKFGHRPAHLLWRSFTLGRLPGTQRGLHQWTRQHQVIVHDGDDLTPAFKLRWGTQPGLHPQQGLLLEAVAMFVRVAPSVAQGHFWQTGVRETLPQRSTLVRVAGPISGSMTQDAHDRHLEVPCLGQRQSMPPSDLDRQALRIGALPTTIGLSICAGVARLQALAIFARRPTFARGRGSRTRQHPLAFEPQHFVER